VLTEKGHHIQFELLLMTLLDFYSLLLLQKLSVKNESSSKSVEQTDLLERRETGTGGDETVVKLKERTCILDSKHGLKKIEFVETETRFISDGSQFLVVFSSVGISLFSTSFISDGSQFLVVFSSVGISLFSTSFILDDEITTELKTTKNCEPAEIKLVENNEIPTELKTTKNYEPAEIKLVENNEIPTELKTTKN
jgi:hypothetical protein